MSEFINYFKNRRNLVNLIVLILLAIGIPLAVNLAKNQQIFRTRAAEPPIVFSGPNLIPAEGQGTPKLKPLSNDDGSPILDAQGNLQWSVDVQITAPDVGSSTQ